MYDAIVIGSRCAGAPTAMLLARRGRRVLVVDRATFPSDVLSGHTIQPAGTARLARWGLLDRVRATGSPFLDTVRFDFGPVVLEGQPAPIDGINDAICIRRTIIDTLLTDAAAEAGAEVRQGFTVKELLWDDGRVVGIRGRDATGATVEERAAIVIGADGTNSFVARAVGAPTYHEQPTETINVYSYWRDVDLDRIELYTRPEPVLRGAPHQRRPVARGRRSCPPTRPTATRTAPRPPSPRRSPRCRTSPTGSTPASASSASAGPPSATGSSARPAAPAGPSSATPATTRTRSPRRGWPTPSGTPSSSPTPSTAASTVTSPPSWPATSRPATPPPCRCTSSPAAWPTSPTPPTAEMLGLVTALDGNPAQISRFLGLIAGSTPIPEFFSPESVGQIMAEAQTPEAAA